jgi:hypothetical protein
MYQCRCWSERINTTAVVKRQLDVIVHYTTQFCAAAAATVQYSKAALSTRQRPVQESSCELYSTHKCSTQ